MTGLVRALPRGAEEPAHAPRAVRVCVCVPALLVGASGLRPRSPSEACGLPPGAALAGGGGGDGGCGLRAQRGPRGSLLLTSRHGTQGLAARVRELRRPPEGAQRGARTTRRRPHPRSPSPTRAGRWRPMTSCLTSSTRTSWRACPTPTRRSRQGSRGAPMPSGRWRTVRPATISSPRRWSCCAPSGSDGLPGRRGPRARDLPDDPSDADTEDVSTCGGRRSSRSTAPTRRTTTTPSGSGRVRWRLPRQRAHRGRRPLRASRDRAGRRSALSRDQCLPPRPGRTHAAGAPLQRPLLARSQEGPSRVLRLHGVRRGRGEGVVRRRKSVIRSVHRNQYRIVQELLDGVDSEETREIEFLREPHRSSSRPGPRAAAHPRREGITADPVDREEVRLRRGLRGGRDRRRAALLLADADRGDRAGGEPGGGRLLPARGLPTIYRVHPEKDPRRSSASRRCWPSMGSACPPRTGSRRGHRPDDPLRAPQAQCGRAGDEDHGARRAVYEVKDRGRGDPLGARAEGVSALHLSDPPLPRPDRAPLAPRGAA